MKTNNLFFSCFFFLLLMCSFQSSAQWSKTAGPPGITVTRFFEYNDILFAGTDAQGVYKSMDDGNTWTVSSSGLENKQILSFTSDATYIYAGTGTGGVYRSSNQGASWTPANAGISTMAVSSLLNAAGYIFAGTIGMGVYRSSDNGSTWVNANGGALGSSYIMAMFYANSTLTVEADNYLFSSNNFGGSWNVDNGPTAFYMIDQIFQRGDTVLAAANGNVFVTQDGGQNWSNVIVVDPDIDILGIDNMQDTLYAGYANGVYRSTNWGQTWIQISSTGLRFGNRYNNHFIIKDNHFLIAFQEIGVYSSTDHGMNWGQVPLSNFAVASSIDNSIVYSGNKLLSGTHNDGVYASTDNGNSWTKTGTPNPLDTLSNGIIFSLINPAPNIILAGACGYGLYRSTDNGSTWVHISNGLPVSTWDGSTCINSLAQSGDKTIAATTEGIFYSSDLGITWHNTNLSSSQVYASGLAVNGNVVCAGVTSFSMGDGIYRSADNGVSWTNTQNVMDIISMSAGANNHFYAGSYSGNYVSADNGVSWNNVGPGIPVNVGGFTILAFRQYVFIGNNEGVFFSSNYGASFSNISTGMDPYPNNAVQGLATDSTFLYAGLFLDGLWRRPLIDFGITTGINQPVYSSSEILASPNPAHDEITISGIQLHINDEIIITDVAGKIIYRTKISENKSYFTLRTDEFPNGIYLLQIKQDDGNFKTKWMKE